MDINNRSNKKHYEKRVGYYFIFSVVTVAVDKIYGIFVHGVHSASMTWMFLYPLLGGSLFYFLILKFTPNITKFVGYRVFSNLHNSGIATLTLSSMLKGIFEIAGTNSPHLVYYYMVGVAFITLGFIIVLIIAINQNKVFRSN